VPAGRRYMLRLRMDRPVSVTVEGRGELPRHAGPDAAGAGWWIDGEGFTLVRLPDQPTATVTVRTTT
jgi:hypothetical protein